MFMKKDEMTVYIPEIFHFKLKKNSHKKRNSLMYI